MLGYHPRQALGDLTKSVLHPLERTRNVAVLSNTAASLCGLLGAKRHYVGCPQPRICITLNS